MKYKVIRKKLLFESMIVAGVLGVLGALMYAIISWHDSKESDNRALKTQLTSLQNEMQSLDSKYTNWRQNNELYEDILEKNKRNQLAINRSLIRNLFARYNDEFILRNVALQMQPVQSIGVAPYKRETLEMVYSEVTVNFSALTDLDVYRLISAMQGDFTGRIKMLSVNIKKNASLNQQTVTAIATEGAVTMVTASIRFLWMGLASLDDPANGGVNAPAP